MGGTEGLHLFLAGLLDDLEHGGGLVCQPGVLGGGLMLAALGREGGTWTFSRSSAETFSWTSSPEFWFAEEVSFPIYVSQ
jgi:hypothetical protein